MSALVLENLSRQFGAVQAVSDVSLDVAEGEIFGLIGPNGSGKTTTLLMLSTLLRPTRGSARMCGFDLGRESDRIRPLLGVMFHDCSLDPDISARANLDLYLRMRGMSAQPRAARVDEVMHLGGLQATGSTAVRNLSWGMRRRVEIARVLADRPRLLLLDEPTLGLDLAFRRDILAVLDQYRREAPATVFFCTHDPDLMAICDRLGFLVEGRLRRVAAVRELQQAYPIDRVAIEVSPFPADNAQVILDSILASGFHAEAMDGSVHAEASSSQQWLPALMAAHSQRISRVSYAHAGLKDIITRALGETVDAR